MHNFEENRPPCLLELLLLFHCTPQKIFFGSNFKMLLGVVYKWRHTNLGDFWPPSPSVTLQALGSMYLCHTKNNPLLPSLHDFICEYYLITTVTMISLNHRWCISVDWLSHSYICRTDLLKSWLGALPNSYFNYLCFLLLLLRNTLFVAVKKVYGVSCLSYCQFSKFQLLNFKPKSWPSLPLLLALPYIPYLIHGLWI